MIAPGRERRIGGAVPIVMGLRSCQHGGDAVARGKKTIRPAAIVEPRRIRALPFGARGADLCADAPRCAGAARIIAKPQYGPGGR